MLLLRHGGITIDKIVCDVNKPPFNNDENEILGILFDNIAIAVDRHLGRFSTI